MSERRILLLNGPNLNQLGTREPALYGKTSLTEINTRLEELGHEYGVDVRAVQVVRACSSVE